MENKKKRARRSFGGRSQTQKESKKKRKRQESNPASPSLETPSNLDIQIDVTNTVVDQLLPEHQNEPFFLTVWFFLIFLLWIVSSFVRVIVYFYEFFLY